MWIALWTLALTQSIQSYDFELDRGLSLETQVVGSVSDDLDDEAAGALARASYSFANIRDAYFSFEAEFIYHNVFEDPLGQRISKYLYGGNIVFYETYNPYAFRFAAGGGVERRRSVNHLMISYRGGLGFYLNPEWSLFGDITNRYLLRSDNWDSHLELSLGLQHIF